MRATWDVENIETDSIWSDLVRNPNHIKKPDISAMAVFWLEEDKF